MHIATYIGACFLSLLCTEGNVQAHTRWWARTGRQHRTDLEICQRPVVCSSWIAVSTMREPGTMVSVSVTFCMLLMPVITKCFTLNLHFVGNNFMYWYTVSQKSSTPKSWQYFCQFLTDFYSSFTVERELNFQQTHVSLPTKPSVCCCTTLEKLEVQILANLICLLSFIISCGCTTLMNWSSRCCIFGMALTTPSLTMQLMGGMGIFVHVCGQKTDTSSKCYDDFQPYDKRLFSFCQKWHHF